MSSIVRLIGWILIVPSALGVLFSVIGFFSVGAAGSEVMASAASDAERTGASIGTGIGAMAALGGAACSLVSGLLGYVLVMKKKVWRCDSCGFILDRA